MSKHDPAIVRAYSNFTKQRDNLNRYLLHTKVRLQIMSPLTIVSYGYNISLFITGSTCQSAIVLRYVSQLPHFINGVIYKCAFVLFVLVNSVKCAVLFKLLLVTMNTNAHFTPMQRTRRHIYRVHRLYSVVFEKHIVM